MRIFFILCLLLILVGGVWIILSLKYGKQAGTYLIGLAKKLIRYQSERIKSIESPKADSVQIEDYTEPKFNDGEIRYMENDIHNPCFSCLNIDKCENICKSRYHYTLKMRQEFDRE